MRCVVAGCGRHPIKLKTEQIHFHCFPNNPKLCKQWLLAIRYPGYNPNTPIDFAELRRLRVCSDHFLISDYPESASYKPHLKPGSVPTIFPWSSEDTGSDVRDNAATAKSTSVVPPQVFPSIKVSPGSSPQHQTEPTPYISRVVAEVCLLQLFQFCENCGFACAPRIQEEEDCRFSVIQDCKLCQYLRKWTSHPVPERNGEESPHENPVDTVSGHDHSYGYSLPSPEDWNFPVEEEEEEDAETQNSDGCGPPDGHKLLRTGDPFVCEVCQRSFTQLMFLTSHMQVHARETPFKCKQCDQCFKHRASLKYHVKKSHVSGVNAKERKRQGFRIQFNRTTGEDPDFKPPKQKRKKKKKSTTGWSQGLKSQGDGLTEETLESQQGNTGTETAEVNQMKEKNCDVKEEEREGHPDGRTDQEMASEGYPGSVIKEEEWGDGYCPNMGTTETFMMNTADIKTEEQEVSLQPPRAQESLSNSEGKQQQQEEERRGAARRTTGRMKRKLMDSANFEYY